MKRWARLAAVGVPLLTGWLAWWWPATDTAVRNQVGSAEWAFGGVSLSAPVAAFTADEPWLACVAYENGARDRLIVAREVRGETPRWTVVAEGARQIVRPCAVQSSDTSFLAWVDVESGSSEVWWASQTGGEAWSPPQRLATPPGPARDPTLVAVESGRAAVVWRQFMEDVGADDLFVAVLGGADAPVAHRLTQDEGHDLEPRVARAGDVVGVVWSVFDREQYDVRFGILDVDGGALHGAGSVSRDRLADDVHPDVAACPDGRFWVAWDALFDERRNASLHVGKPHRAPQERDLVQLRMACVQVEGDEFVVQWPEASADGLAPSLVVSGDPLISNGGTPAVAVDRSGRVHLAYRVLSGAVSSGSPAYGVARRTLSAEGWSDVQDVETSGGRSERPTLVSSGPDLFAAWQCDRGRRSSESPWLLADSTESDHVVRLSHLFAEGAVAWSWSRGTDAPSSPALVTAPAATEVARSSHLSDVTDPIQSGRAHHEVQDGDAVYRVYWGDLHRHSNLSNCSKGWEPSPSTRYEFGRDAGRYDFYCLTDHAGQIDPSQWWELSKAVDYHRSPGFVTFQGYEWSHRFYGHQNVILRSRTDQVFSPRLPEMENPGDLWDALGRSDVITIPHTTASDEMGYRWEWADTEKLRLVEVYQACRGSFEFEGAFRRARFASLEGGFVHDGLDEGARFGLVASTDHGNGASYAAVLATDLTREALFDAMRARRTYGSTTKGMLVDFRVNGAMQGSDCAADGPPTVTLSTRGTAELSDVVIYRDGEAVHTVGREDALPGRGNTLLLEFSLDKPRRARKLPAFEVTLEVDRGRLSRADGGRREEAPRVPGHAWLECPTKKRAVWHRPDQARPASLATLNQCEASLPPDANLTITWPDGSQTFPASDLLRRPWRAPLGKGEVRLELSLVGRADATVQADVGLGRDALEVSWVDDEAPTEPGTSWYSARVIQTDREVAWSSPVFVTRGE